MTKENFKKKLIEVLESRYLEVDLTDSRKKRGKLMTVNHLSYVALSPEDIEPMADRLVGIICNKENAARLLECQLEKKDLILKALFPARELFPKELINPQRERTAADVSRTALGVMMMKQFSGLIVATPEGVMEPTAATAAAPGSSSEHSA